MNTRNSLQVTAKYYFFNYPEDMQRDLPSEDRSPRMKGLPSNEQLFSKDYYYGLKPIQNISFRQRTLVFLKKAVNSTLNESFLNLLFAGKYPCKISENPPNPCSIKKKIVRRSKEKFKKLCLQVN